MSAGLHLDPEPPASTRGRTGPQRLAEAARSPRTLGVAAALCLVPGLAHGHQAGLSYGAYALDSSVLDVVLRIPTTEVAAAFSGLAAPEALHARVPVELPRALFADLAIVQGARPCELLATDGRPEAPDGLRLAATYRCPGGAEPLDVRLGFVARMAPGHVHLARVEAGGTQEHVVDARHLGFRVEARGEGLGRAASFVRLGIEHILTGWDHLAFLLALLLAGAGLKEALRTVTGFTVGHALTLALATLGALRPPAAVIEPLIAASIVFAAGANLRELRRREPRGARRWPIAAAFGLVHGFGFAGALLELRLPRAGLFTALLSFNAGVELGQAAIVALAVPILVWLRRSRLFATAGLATASAAIGCAGAVWLVERISW